VWLFSIATWRTPLRDDSFPEGQDEGCGWLSFSIVGNSREISCRCVLSQISSVIKVYVRRYIFERNNALGRIAVARESALRQRVRANLTPLSTTPLWARWRSVNTAVPLSSSPATDKLDVITPTIVRRNPALKGNRSRLKRPVKERRREPSAMRPFTSGPPVLYVFPLLHRGIQYRRSASAAIPLEKKAA